MNKNIFDHEYETKLSDREKKYGHKSCLIWFTGLSGSGKSTICNKLEIELFKSNINTVVLDGDNVRSGINQDLDFSLNGRKENIRRIAEISKLFIDAGIVVCAAFISPLASERNNVKKIVGENRFYEIYISTSLSECEKRDVKGLYSRARNGEIKNFTGISSPYQPPEDPFLEINTEKISVESAVKEILKKIKQKIK